VPAALAVPVPDGVSDGAALAVLLQGLTAWHLYRTAGRVAPGETVVVVSGAGGVGSLSREQNAVRTGKLLRTSRAVVGFWLFHVTDDPAIVRPPLQELFERLARGELRVL
jgi:hypothetical protein